MKMMVGPVTKTGVDLGGKNNLTFHVAFEVPVK